MTLPRLRSTDMLSVRVNLLLEQVHDNPHREVEFIVRFC